MQKKQNIYNLSERENRTLFFEQPFNLAESYKVMRTNLNFASLNRNYKKIVITSALPNEGKSSVAINLSAALVETGARVILIECDMRSPKIKKYLSVARLRSPGLSSILIGEANISDSINLSQELKFHYITSGPIPPNPAELLESQRMRALLKAIEPHYDYIICDTPPISLVTDAAVLSQACDGVVLVVRQNYSTREQVKQAKQQLDAVQATIIGTVLNACDSLMQDSNVYEYGKRKRK